MPRIAGLLAAFAVLGVVLAGCAGGSPSPAEYIAAPTTPTTKVIPAPVSAIAKVPTDLEGTTMGDAKAQLAKIGFTRVVVAGGFGITNSTEVADVTHAGEPVAMDTKIVLTGEAPAPSPSTSPPTYDGCAQDEDLCATDEPECETGSCEDPRRELPSEYPPSGYPTTENPPSEYPTSENPPSENPPSESPSSENPTSQKPTSESPSNEKPSDES